MSTFDQAATAAYHHLIVSLMLLVLHETAQDILPKGILYWIIKVKVPKDIFEETYHAFYADLQAEASIVWRWKMVIGLIFIRIDH